MPYVIRIPSSEEKPRGLKPAARRGRALTLIELLVVIAIVSMLASILLPSLSRARGQAQAVTCRSNIRQLALANTMYVQEGDGVYCPGASSFRQNLHRWHGERNTISEPFDPASGPLVPFLGPDKRIRQCPSFEPDKPGFEAGNGGYGYNNAFIGVKIEARQPGVYIVTDDKAGAFAHRVRRPGETLMFSDAAFVDGTLIEYSFAEPRYHPQYGVHADPSIHFRHHGSANVAWCDGHVSAERRTHTWSSGYYEGNPDREGLGWFGRADDNAFFDLE